MIIHNDVKALEVIIPYMDTNIFKTLSPSHLYFFMPNMSYRNRPTLSEKDKQSPELENLFKRYGFTCLPRRDVIYRKGN